MTQILVVDDEIGIRELLSEILGDEGYTVLLAENAALARRIRDERLPDLVLLDIWMPDMDGISLLKEWSSTGQLTMPVIMMSGHGTIDTAVEATRIGAVGFLEKPIALQKLLTTVKDTLKHGISMKKQRPAPAIFEHSSLFRDFRKRLAQAAAKTRVLLIRNVSGHLAEIGARTLQTSRMPWLDLSVSSAPLTQVMLEETAGGLLFVPDLTALSKSQQKNIVFVLERLEKYHLKLIVALCSAFPPSGGADWSPSLFARLCEASISFPPVEGHAEEIPAIAAFLLSYLVERGEAPKRHFSEEVLNALRCHKWENGWMELLAAVKSLALFALEEEISRSDAKIVLQREENAPSETLPPLFQYSLRDAREIFERMYFEHHLKSEQGNMARIADSAGLERTHLYRKLKQLGLSYGRRSEESES
ncbi:MAG: response regulator [Candidatus Accumulibacter sp.]|jgi:DNA-binding NtrC family response regulator|nr:response regulator [Accumulibacter sp.]